MCSCLWLFDLVHFIFVDKCLIFTLLILLQFHGVHSSFYWLPSEKMQLEDAGLWKDSSVAQPLPWGPGILPSFSWKFPHLETGKVYRQTRSIGSFFDAKNRSAEEWCKRKVVLSGLLLRQIFDLEFHKAACIAMKLKHYKSATKDFIVNMKRRLGKSCPRWKEKALDFRQWWTNGPAIETCKFEQWMKVWRAALCIYSS